jgi:hypothetical protein
MAVVDDSWNMRPEDRDEVARLDAETDRIIAEQKKKDLERLQQQLAANPPQRPSSSHQKPRSPVIEKFVFLTKGRKNRDGLSPGLSPGLSSASSTIGSFDFHSQTNSVVETPRHIPTGIEPGGKGIVPQTDAPASAINNSGERVSCE